MEGVRCEGRKGGELWEGGGRQSEEGQKGGE